MQKERTSLAKKVGFKKKRDKFHPGAGKISLDQHVFLSDNWIIPSWQIKITATLWDSFWDGPQHCIQYVNNYNEL